MKKLLALIILSLVAPHSNSVCASQFAEQGISPHQNKNLLQLKRKAKLKGFAVSKQALTDFRKFLKDNLSADFDNFLTKQYGEGNEKEARNLIAQGVMNRVRRFIGTKPINSSLLQLQSGLKRSASVNKSLNVMDLYLTGQLINSYFLSDMTEEESLNYNAMVSYNESLKKIGAGGDDALMARFRKDNPDAYTIAEREIQDKYPNKTDTEKTIKISKAVTKLQNKYIEQYQLDQMDTFLHLSKKRNVSSATNKLQDDHFNKFMAINDPTIFKSDLLNRYVNFTRNNPVENGLALFAITEFGTHAPKILEKLADNVLKNVSGDEQLDFLLSGVMAACASCDTGYEVIGDSPELTKKKGEVSTRYRELNKMSHDRVKNGGDAFMNSYAYIQKANKEKKNKDDTRDPLDLSANSEPNKSLWAPDAKVKELYQNTEESEEKINEIATNNSIETFNKYKLDMDTKVRKIREVNGGMSEAEAIAKAIEESKEYPQNNAFLIQGLDDAMFEKALAESLTYKNENTVSSTNSSKQYDKQDINHINRAYNRVKLHDEQFGRVSF
jgi:hypothetical protein